MLHFGECRTTVLKADVSPSVHSKAITRNLFFYFGYDISHSFHLSLSFFSCFPLFSLVAWCPLISIWGIWWVSSSQYGGEQYLRSPDTPGTTPVYLADECTLVSAAGRRPLRSADNWTCLVKRSCNQFSDHCFATTGPTLWNSLPEQLRQPDITFGQFKRSLKTFMFG